MGKLELIPIAAFPMVEPGDDLARLVIDALSAQQLTLQSGDLLVLAQKVVSKAENRYVKLSDVVPGAAALALAQEVGKDPALVELILQESVAIVAKRPGVLIVEHRCGYVHANAGIDQSNLPGGGGRALLLPEDADASARALRERLQTHYQTDLAVIINDSAGRPWRLGTCGMAIGAAGLTTYWDRVGEQDLFGRTLQATQIAAADELAAAASWVMGQADEGVPVVLIRGAQWRADEQGSAKDLLRPRHQDMFR